MCSAYTVYVLCGVSYFVMMGIYTNFLRKWLIVMVLCVVGVSGVFVFEVVAQDTVDTPTPPVVSEETVTDSENGGDTGTVPSGEELFENPIEYNTLEEVLFGLLNGIITILIPIIVIGIVYIGFRMVLAAQEKSAKYTELKNAFIWSLVGLFLILGGKGILSVIQNTVGGLLRPEYSDVADP